jgi:tripartite-type tricarboxylate transporter receptor subunit TctC
MTIIRRQFLRIATGAATLPFVHSVNKADAYPSRPVKILVGFPSGGPVDIAARNIGKWLTQRLGQTFGIENMPGESGNIAARAVVKAAPDGYTLLLCGPVNTINTTLFPDLDFDFARDVVPVAGLYRVPLVVEVNPSLEIDTAAEFLAHAKAHPGKLKVAHAGCGTPHHVGLELFKSMSGVDLTLVRYLGSSPALADLLSGKVDAMFDPLPSSIGYIRSGKLRALAVTAFTQSEAFSAIPSMTDYLPGYGAGSWFGISAPKGTPVPIVERLNDQTNAALADPKAKACIAELGGTEISGPSASFAAFIATETERYRQVIRTANIKLR